MSAPVRVVGKSAQQMSLDGMSQVEGTPEGMPEANESFQGRGHGKRLTLVPPL